MVTFSIAIIYGIIIFILLVIGFYIMSSGRLTNWDILFSFIMSILCCIMMTVVNNIWIYYIGVIILYVPIRNLVNKIMRRK
jgi:hypothetical protein